MNDIDRLGLQSMPPELMKLAKEQFGSHYIQFEIWVGHVIDRAFDLGKRSTAPNRPCPRCGVNEGEECRDFDHVKNRCNDTEEKA